MPARGWRREGLCVMADSYEHFADPSCTHCQTLLRMLNSAAIDLENQESDLKVKRRQLAEKDRLLKRQEDQVVVGEQTNRIFELFRVIRNKTDRFALDKNRREAIGRLLGLGYTEADFRQAFMGIAIKADRHPDGDRHYTLNFVCKDADTLEKFRDAYLREWAQFDQLLERMDHKRLMEFAEGRDPASMVELPPENVVRFEKPARRVA